MCGIIGYVGRNKKAIPVLIDGLKKLEYRGYDSAGIAYLNKKIKIIKSKGKIENLENKINIEEESNLGIGHTRWATHGEANETNCHPHKVGNITIVHNGIIENFKELKEDILKEYKFISDTDTEVAAALINYNYTKSNDVLLSLKDSINDLKGSYAIGIMCDNDNNLYVIKNKSPLIIGVGKDENYISSDINAILKHTNKYIILDDLEIAKISPQEIKIYNKDLELLNKEILISSKEDEVTSKNGFEHFMKKEMFEQPKVIKDTINEYLTSDEKWELPDITKYKCIDIVGCGSAMHAGMIGKYLIEKYADIEVHVEVASEYRYKKLFNDQDTLVILISQSGETADTLAALEIAKQRGSTTLAIVNVEASSIARLADITLYTKAGAEIAVATTKAYLAQVAILSMLAISSGYIKGNITDIEMTKITKEIEALPKIINKILQSEEYIKIAKTIYNNNDIYFLGRQIDYAIALEGSLKLKEISYIHSEAYQAGELKHGTISLIEDNIPVIGVITDKNIMDKTISNLKEVSARGAKIITIITSEMENNMDFAYKKIIIPTISEMLQPIISIIPLQMISYEVAKLRGCDIDKPKNLAKSVTVE